MYAESSHGRIFIPQSYALAVNKSAIGYLSNPFISTVYKSHDPSLPGHVCREWKGERNRDCQGSILIRTTMYATFMTMILRRYCSRGWFVFEGSKGSEASTSARHKITTHGGTRVRPFGLNPPYRNPDFRSLGVSCFEAQLVLLFFSNRDPYRQKPNVRDRGERRDQNHVGTGSVRFSSLVEKLSRILAWIMLLCLSNGPLKSFIVSRLAAYFLHKRRVVDNRWNSSRTVSPFEIVFSFPSWNSWIFQLGRKKGSVIWLWRKRFV